MSVGRAAVESVGRPLETAMRAIRSSASPRFDFAKIDIENNTMAALTDARNVIARRKTIPVRRV